MNNKFEKLQKHKNMLYKRDTNIISFAYPFNKIFKHKLEFLLLKDIIPSYIDDDDFKYIEYTELKLPTPMTKRDIFNS